MPYQLTEILSALDTPMEQLSSGKQIHIKKIYLATVTDS